MFYRLYYFPLPYVSFAPNPSLFGVVKKEGFSLLSKGVGKQATEAELMWAGGYGQKNTG
jgi:hypothetical protein